MMWLHIALLKIFQPCPSSLSELTLLNLKSCFNLRERHEDKEFKCHPISDSCIQPHRAVWMRSVSLPLPVTLHRVSPFSWRMFSCGGKNTQCHRKEGEQGPKECLCHLLWSPALQRMFVFANYQPSLASRPHHKPDPFVNAALT